jgi:hypothetical protein
MTAKPGENTSDGHPRLEARAPRRRRIQ